MERTNHQGNNVKRFREMLGMKQLTLADILGDDWTQKKISLLEQKELIEPAILAQIGKAFGISAEALTKFDEQTALNVISNIYDSRDDAILTRIHSYYPFNPIVKIIELYEALLKSEREKKEFIERIFITKQN